VLGADPAAPQATGGGGVGAEQVLAVRAREVRLVRAVAGELHDQRGEDRDQDDQQDHRRADDRDLVLLQPRPRDLAERTAFDLMCLGRLRQVINR
jgi:hypothetical protein